MITHANLQSNLSICFLGEDLQIMNMHYNKKNSPDPVGASFIDGSNLF